MKKITEFLKAHPMLVACVTTAVLAAGVAELVLVDAIYKAIGEPLDSMTIAFHFLVIIAIPVMWWCAKGFTKITAVVLALSLTFGVPRAQAVPIVIGVGAILIVVGGGVIGCKAVNKCNKIAKAREHKLTNESPFFIAGTEPEYAALFTWTEDTYCAEERLLPTTPVLFTMCPEMEPSGVSRMLTRADKGYEFTETWQEFEQEVAEHGLFIAKPSSYSRAGHPCEVAQVPITFSTNTHTVTIGGGGLLMSVERSTDLMEWTAVLTINVEPTAQLRIEEVGEDKCFYRITTREP